MIAPVFVSVETRARAAPVMIGALAIACSAAAWSVGLSVV